MSQYPSYPSGYGQYPGQHQQQQPYGFQNAPGYPAHGQLQYNSSAAQINRGASQAAFDLNSANIPGLGVGSAPPLGVHRGFAPSSTSWTPQPAFPAPIFNVQPPPFYQSPSSTSRARPDDAPIDDQSRTAKPASTPTRPTSGVDIEEGELSEGQFEDLYEPREYTADAPTHPVSKPLATADPSQPTSAADTPEGGFYGSDEDDAAKGSGANEGLTPGFLVDLILWGRNGLLTFCSSRSIGILFPFSLPREVQPEISTPQLVASKDDGNLLSRAPPIPTQTPSAASASDVSGLRFAEHSSVAALSSNGLRGASSQEQPKIGPNSLKSLQEAKKEARKAILRLWPLGVKYQNYIDEGFDEKLIKGLFRDLHLDMPKSITETPTTQPKAAQPLPANASNSTIPTQPAEMLSPQTSSASKDSSAIADQARKGEERKDRIARLLAAKAAKPPTALSPLASTATQPKPKSKEPQSQATAPISSISAPPKTRTWGEKERLLQQKIAALQKSREAQAHKSTTELVAPGDIQAGVDGPSGPQPNSAATSLPMSIPTGPRVANLSLTGKSTPTDPSQGRPPIPGLGVSPSTQPNLGNQRKRPVALDFVEYSSEPIPAKRPFGQSRKETSLIIDVSDVSDDEEMEMDMDMGSPIDETLPIQSSGIAGQRGPSIRDFPPLTDTFTQRQFSSPAPSITPPGAPINKKRETELNRKEKAIQEMKRRIALAEARRKAKQSNGSETPNQPGQLSLNGNDTPRLPPTERANFVSSPDRLHAPSPQLKPESSSTKLPKPSELPHLDPRQRADRRGRIMSLDIPRVELSLQEKLARLHQLQDEQARLRAEIDRSIAEKQKLADELQQLDTTPVESSRPNGLSESRTRSASQASRETGEASTDGAEASRPQSRGDDALRTTQLATTGLASDNGISGDEPGENVEEASEWIAREFEVSTNTLPDAPANSEPNLMQRHANAQADAPDSLVPTSTSKGMVEKFMTATSTSEPADSANADETTPMDLDSRASSPEVTELVSNAGADEETNNSRQHPTPLPEQISTVAQPREAVQELEGEAPPEVHDEPAQEPQGSLTSYESPLRYFHAYRFHPEYQRTVAGGLKSLTYSNRIDPDREFCPFELNGEQCPANCQFQHFGSIALQDDQILLELGNPDGYNSEEKARFIQGLRELLQRFKADKVKDFNTIARGIIDFRSQLLGDKSKILRLDGVKL